MKHYLCALLIGSWALQLDAEFIDITQKSTGKTLSVRALSYNEGLVKFQVEGKRVFEVPEGTLTEDSLERIRKTLTQTQSKFGDLATRLNDVAGHQLLGKQSLWTENAEQVAQRMAIPEESKKDNSSSYRLYPQKDFLLFGAHPYCVTLYGKEENQVESLSIVFANKGDYGSQLGMGEDHFRRVHPDKELPNSLEEAIKLDVQILDESFTKVLGEAQKQYFGEKEDKRRVKRWDLDTHAFLLSAKDEEYVSLLIVPTEVANAEGKVTLVSDSKMKAIQAANLKRAEHGDVWIHNIPMVNQGPKGYCAPATFERAMRYMKIPADMYLLATAATAPGGGTNTTQLSDDCKRIVRSKARKIRELDLQDDLSMKTVKKYIDKGVPILWQMCSLDSYNQLANRRTKERTEVTNFEEWTASIAEEADAMKDSLSITGNYHICMIIGYNEETNELAVSDSWGPAYELRWVHLEIAEAVTSRGGFVIDY